MRILTRVKKSWPVKSYSLSRVSGIYTSVHHSSHIDRPLCRNIGQNLLLQATQVELESGARRQLPTKENHQTDLVTAVVPLNCHLNQCGSSY